MKSIASPKNGPQRPPATQGARRAFAEVRAAMAADYAARRSWRAVAQAWGVSTGVAWRIVVKGVEPAAPAIRDALRLAATATVISVDGEIPDGAQAGPWRRCVVCDAAYLTNHPRRKKCFICSPYRGKKKPRV